MSAAATPTDAEPATAGTVLDRLSAFLDASTSPYHAVDQAATQLTAAGFTEVVWGEPVPRGPGSGFTRRDGQLLAWSIPQTATPGSPVVIVGAHTDSPNLRVKARPDLVRHGWDQVGVEVYGGVLLNSWLDRDLGLSGRVVVRTPDGFATRLVKVDRPLLRVPQLAIHLDREIYDKGLALNRQTHLTPIWGTSGTPDVRAFVADELGIDADDVLTWELMTHDLTPASVLGHDRTLFASGRLDNLASCHAALEALIGAAADPPEAGTIAAIALFDHEEVGSTSTTGAGGPSLGVLLEQLGRAVGGDDDDLRRSLAASIVVSADMAHAIHPNYPDRHDPAYAVQVNRGPVLKLNANQRYASSATSTARFVLACEQAGVEHQVYVHRNDLPCGSTIGPITASGIGVDVVDVGLAQLSMHSAREMMGADDQPSMIAAISRLIASPDGAPG